MKLSVLMITYNHEKYIAQALDSVLMQKVDLDYEIVIGEDCSTDNTRNIVLEYQRRYPNKIRALLPDKNLGMMRNFLETYSACNGEYVAILEGDDYWTSPQKLQKQFNCLATNPKCVISCHAVKAIDEIDNEKSFDLRPRNHNTVFNIKDILKHNVVPTCSCVFKRGLFQQFPDWFLSLKMGDWPLHVLNAQYGDICYIDEFMAVYRLHGSSAWSSSAHINRVESTIEAYKIFNAHFNFKYDKEIRAGIANQYYNMATYYYDNKNTDKYVDNMVMALKNKFFGTAIRFIDLLRVLKLLILGKKSTSNSKV